MKKKGDCFAKIGFENFAIECVIGCHPKERDKPQIILIDLEVIINLKKFCNSEILKDTTDYTLLAKLCKKEAELHQFQLLESYALHMVDLLMDCFPLKKIRIRVKKPKALENANFAYVEIEKDCV
jgi:dihydroneopterin aldolase